MNTQTRERVKSSLSPLMLIFLILFGFTGLFADGDTGGDIGGGGGTVCVANEVILPTGDVDETRSGTYSSNVTYPSGDSSNRYYRYKFDYVVDGKVEIDFTSTDGGGSYKVRASYGCNGGSYGANVTYDISKEIPTFYVSPKERIENNDTIWITVEARSGQDIDFTMNTKFTTLDEPVFKIRNNFSKSERDTTFNQGVTVYSYGITSDTSVDFNTSDGTALAGSDYSETSTTLTFKPGDTSNKKNSNIPIIGDDIPESPEYLKANISNPTAGIIVKSDMNLTILDDDFYGEEDFKIRNPEDTRNIRGNIASIGNTALCYGVKKRDENNQWINYSNGSRAYFCEENSESNNDTYLRYVNNKGVVDYPYNNSSDASLSIDENATIVWAGFYTQGYLKDSAVNTNNKLRETPVILSHGDINISIEPDKVNLAPWEWLKGTTARTSYTYSTFTDISDELNGKKGSEINGVWTGINIKAKQGQDGTAYGQSDLGFYGAWSLVLIYKSENEDIRNISVFDGYKKVFDDSTDILIDGFFTPSEGNISSTISFFAGEGDISTNGDVVKVNGTEISLETNNAFNSSTVGFDAIPNLSNNFGIDIQNLDAGTSGNDVIKNRDRNATITLSSGGSANPDAYYPSMITFSTELYVPNICYEEHLKDVNGSKFPKNHKIKIGDPFMFETFFRNAPNFKDPTANIVQAEGAQVEIVMDEHLKHVYMDEESGDIYEHNTSLTGVYVAKETPDDNNFSTALAQTNMRFDENATGEETDFYINIGDGADEINGGILPTQKEVSLRINYDINETDSNLSLRNSYFISYNHEALPSLPRQEIRPCSDFVNEITVYEPIIGYFNTAHAQTITSDPKVVTDVDFKSINALYTQVDSKDFNVTVVSLDNDQMTPKNYSGVVFLDFVDLKDNNNSEESCLNAPVIELDDLAVEFDDVSQVRVTLNIPAVARNGTIRMNYFDWENRINESNVTCVNVSNMSSNLAGVPQCLNSENKLNDLFPGNNCLDAITGAPCKSSNHGEGSGKYDHEYGCAQCLYDVISDTICARDNFAVRPDRYEIDTSTISGNLKAGQEYNITVEAVEYGSNNKSEEYNQSKVDNLTTNIIINAGNKYMPDNTTINNSLNGDISFSSFNFDFVNGRTEKMGISYDDVGIIAFDINDTTWSDIDEHNDDTPFEDRVIRGTAKVTFIPYKFTIPTISIVNNENSSFTYLSDDLNMSAKLPLTLRAENKQGDLTQNYANNLFEKDITITPFIYSNFLSADANTTTFSNEDMNFTSGKSSLAWNDNSTIKFNFDRDEFYAKNPFDVNNSEVSVTATDTDSVYGEANNTATNFARFYYGRVHAPDHRFVSATGTAQVYYEVYCDDCNKTDFNIDGNESIDSINWFTNTLHVNSDGNVTKFASVGDVEINGNNGDTEPSGTITSGNEKLPLNANHSLPYKDKIDMNSSSWLIYSPTDFMVEFYGEGQWAGQGIQGKTIDLNISKRQNKRLDWWLN